jgi:hypothetical protein
MMIATISQSSHGGSIGRCKNGGRPAGKGSRGGERSHDGSLGRLMPAASALFRPLLARVKKGSSCVWALALDDPACRPRAALSR